MRRICLLVMCLMTAVSAATAATVAAPGTSAALRSGLPGPERQVPQAGTVQFVGQDGSRTFNIAVVRSARGAVLAYVCDGRRTGRWLTGVTRDGVAVLAGPAGSTMRVAFARQRVAGRARIGGRAITFNLPRAIRASGLFREVEGGIEAAWILTNAGITRGLASEEGGKTVATSSSTSSPTDPDGGVSVPPGGDAPEPAILEKFRCSRIVLAYHRALADVARGRPVRGPSAEELADKFLVSGCGEWYAL